MTEPIRSRAAQEAAPQTQEKQTFTNNANFRLLLFSAIALAGLLAFGVWAATGRGSHTASNNANAPMREAQASSVSTGRAATVITPAPSKPSHSEYHATSTAVKNTASKPQAKQTAKTAPAAAHPSRTPSADSMDSSPDTSSDEDSNSADSNSDPDSSDSATSSDKSTDKNSDTSSDSTGK